MREIKFRAWNYELKKMLNWESIKEHSKNFIFGYGTLYYMQYTGLKDKNGHEIYEGDILENRGKWRVYYVKTLARFMMRPLTQSGYEECMSFIGMKDFKIIGNIYENPELLEANHEQD